MILHIPRQWKGVLSKLGSDVLRSSRRTVRPDHGEVGSPNHSADKHIALPERPNDGKAFPFEHADRAEPSGHRFPVRGRIRFHDAASSPPNGLQRPAEGDPGYTGPTKRSIHEEARDSPARRGPELACHRPVLPSSFDPRQIFAPAELTPTNRFAVSVHKDSVSVPFQKQGVMVASVRLLTTLALEWTCRTLAMVEHAPAAGLYTVIFSKEALEISPR